MPLPHLRLALATLLALGIAGCGGADDAGDGDVAVDAEGTSTAGAATDQLFDTDFAQVCRETGQPRAAAYTPGPGVHPVLVLTSADGAEYSGSSATLPEGWGVVFPNLAATQLVACARRTAATPTHVCDGYKDDDTGTEWSVQLHDATYEYTLRVARTGEVLATETFDVPAGSCPMLSMYSDGDPQPQPSYPSVGDGELELFVRPFVTGN